MSTEGIRIPAAVALLGLCGLLGGGAAAAALPALSVAQILDKNAAARGGLPAWRAVQTMTWKGHMGAGASTYMAVGKNGRVEKKEREEAQLPFALELKRPFKSRLEITFNGQTAVQVYDGTQGWKLRPYLGRGEAEPFTPAELKQVAAEPGIDGYLIDASAKGSKISLAGTDKVEGHDAYKLGVALKDGQMRHVWVDGASFLEVKIEGLPRTLDGRSHAVSIFPRDYRAEGGLQLPHRIETAVAGVRKVESMVIESVAVNPAIDDRRFAQPK